MTYNTHGLESDVKKAVAVLIECPQCGLSGPKDRLAVHERVDHWNSPKLPARFTVDIPPRFKPVLDELAEWSERTYTDMVKEALDEWLKGRAPKGFRTGSGTYGPRTGWGA